LAVLVGRLFKLRAGFSTGAGRLQIGLQVGNLPHPKN
jgi:hypothetical protein